MAVDKNETVITVRLPRELHEKLTSLAVLDRRSLNAFIVVALEREAEKVFEK